MIDDPAIERKPCGCVLTAFPNGRRMYAPCVACALARAGAALAQASAPRRWKDARDQLAQAGAALSAAATTITREKNLVQSVNDALAADPDEA